MANKVFRILVYLFIFLGLSSAGILYAAPTGGNVDQQLMSQLQSSAQAAVRVEYHALTGKVRFIGAAPEAPVKNLKAAGLSREDGSDELSWGRSMARFVPTVSGSFPKNERKTLSQTDWSYEADECASGTEKCRPCWKSCQN